MAEASDKFNDWVALVGSMLPNIPHAFMFDNAEKDLDAFIKKYLDRQDLVDHLKELQGKPVKAKDWSGVVAKVDFLSASERDLRMRFRRRVAGMSIADTSRGNAAVSVQTMSENIAAMMGGDQTTPTP